MTLIIGVATAGPSDNLYNFTNFQDYLDMFGGVYTQVTEITPSATACTLDYPVFSTVFNNVSGDGVNQLYDLQITDSEITFGNIGGLTNKRLELTYRPYLQEQDLLTAVQTFSLLGSELPFVYRVQGTPAKVTIGDWEFSSRYSGEKYNNYLIQSDGSTLTIKNKISAETLQFTVNDELSNSVLDYFYKGISDFYISEIGTTLIGSGYTSGGTDGEISADIVSEVLNTIGINQYIDTVLILTGYDTSYNSLIEDYNSKNQEVMFYFSGPGDNYSIPSSQGNNNNISVVMGFTSVNYGSTIKERYAVEPVVASIQNSINLTNYPVKLYDYSPTYTKSELENLKALGLMGVTRRTSKGLVIYESATLGNQNSYHYTRIKTHIYSQVYPYLQQYLSKNLLVGSQPNIAKDIFDIVSKISEIEVNKVSSEVYEGSEFDYNFDGDYSNNYITKVLYNEIDITYYGEILEVKIGINLLPR